jgi:predicted RNA-binding protein YlxR (DUF448 family)
LAKKIPMRMCVSCREMRPKKELTRVVRTPEGEVLIDPTGRANGRGAYLCLKTACLEKAIKSRALERTLEVAISKETYEALRKDCENAEAEQTH